MKQLIFLFVFFAQAQLVSGQNTAASSTTASNITINKDARLDVLAQKEIGFNQAMAMLPKAQKGYRLMLLNTSDRALAMRVRSLLLQHFPEQKVYMSFQPPYIKLKFGDFLEKDDADEYKTEIEKAKISSANIYIVPDIIEVKPDKTNSGNNQ